MQFLKKIKTRIALSFSLLFLAVAIPAIIYAFHQVGLFFQGIYMAQMQTAGNTVSATYSTETAAHLDSISAAVSRITGSSVFVISPDGGILAKHYETPSSDTAYQVSLPILAPDSSITGQGIRHRIIEVDRHRYLQVQAQLPDANKLLQVKSLDSVSFLMYQMRRVIIYASFLTLIALVAMAFWVSANITHKLERLTAFAQKIRTDRYPDRIEIESPDEVGDLAQSLNEMAEDLRHSRERVANLETIRREFFARVREELLAPLGTIRANLEAVNSSIPGNDPRCGVAVHQALHRVASLERTMRALIEISRLELGETTPQAHPFKLRDLIFGVADSYRNEIEERSLSLGIEIGPELENSILMGDDKLLEIVLSNLISNAIACTAEGHIKIVCFNGGDRVKVTVEDSGRGISAEYLDRIFERLYRIPRASDVDPGLDQAGLGLAIAKHIIDAHGQKLEVDSQIGLGSKFSFYIMKCM